MQIMVHTDGGARGNPGPAAIGVVIEIIQNSKFKIQNDNVQNKEEKQVIEISKRIGETTNNVAEYLAVIAALKNIKYSLGKARDEQISNPPAKIDFFLDSRLVANQLNGLFKVKDSSLRQLLTHVRILEQEVGGVVTYTVVPREQNWRADLLVNKALDEA